MGQPGMIKADSALMNLPSKIPGHYRVDGIWDVPQEVADEVQQLSPYEKQGLITEVLKQEPHQTQTPVDWRARALGVEAEQLLIKVLRLPKSYVVPKAQVTRSGRPREHTDAEKALSMIRPGIYPELVALLKPHLADPNYKIRQRVAEHLIAFGSDAVAGTLATALHDSNEWVRSGAKLGLQEALTPGRATVGFIQRAWDCMERNLRSPTVSAVYDPVRFMEQIDLPRTLQLINAREFLRADHPILDVILGTLVRHRVAVAPEALKEIAEQLPARCKETMRKPVLRCLLLAFAISQVSWAKEFIEDAIRHEGMANPGYRALALLEGSESLQGLAMSAYKASPEIFEHLPASAQNIVLLTTFENTKGPGAEGFFDVYGHPVSNDPQALLAALEQVGAAEHLPLWSQAMHLLSGGEAWPHHEDRKRRVDEILNGPPNETDEEEDEDSEESQLWDALHHLGQQWDDASIPLFDTVARYSWEHRADAALMPLG